MKKLFLFLLVISFASCLPDVMEFWIEENESGKISFDFDISDEPGALDQIGLLPSMFSGNTENPVNVLDTQNSLDTIFSMYDLEKPEALDTMSKGNIDLLKSISIWVKANKELQSANIALLINFKNKEHLIKLSETFNGLSKQKGQPELALNLNCIDFKFHPETEHAETTVKDITFFKKMPEFMSSLKMVDSISHLVDSLKQLPDSLKTMESEFQGSIAEMGLLEMQEGVEQMIGGDVEIIINLPYPIQFANSMNATIDQKQFKYKMSKKDLVLDEQTQTFIIKYKQ